MAKWQTSPIGKLLAWLLLLGFTFGGAVFGLRALEFLPYQETADWQESASFQKLLREREYALANGMADALSLEGDALSYVERERLKAEQAELERELAAENTGFRFQLRNADGAVLSDNLAAGEELSEAVDRLYYASFTLGNGVVATLEDGEDYYVDERGLPRTSVTVPEVYVIECGVRNDPSGTDDEFARLFARYEDVCARWVEWAVEFAVCGILALVCLGYVLWTAGRREGEERAVLTWQEKIFFDVYLLAAVCAGTALCAAGLAAVEYLYELYCRAASSTDALPVLLGAAALAAAFVGVLALTLRTFAVRCKTHTLAKTTLLCRFLRWCWRAALDFGRSLPLTWRTLFGFAAYFFLNLLLFNEGRSNELAALLWCLLNLGALGFLCWWTACFRRLRKGGQAIAAGNLNHRVDTHRMPHDLRCHAEDLNNISVGLSGAVDEKMKSERFKAELITNVSHDLKTPLTSILNYVNLLKTTEQTDPKAVEYIEVLDRKSMRLKKLTEDLVEASKASTGALRVNREKIGLGQLVDQALGEWKEKLEDRQLTPVVTLPDGETWVYADGRHLWRVIDNLLSNCAKYAMEGTRVYLDLTRGHGQVTLSVKNISREALNVPPERLLERFVRGEESRTTEGSGLGLSIARSLTELQGGAFELTVDGDLFKASVTLPQAG